MKAIIITVGLIICSCSSMKPIAYQPETDSASLPLKTGHIIWVRTIDGDEFKMTVATVTEDHIVGKNRSVALDQIESLKIKKFSPLKTTGVAALGLTVAAVVALKSLLGGL